MRKLIKRIVREYLNEEIFNGLVLYRGEEKEWLSPTDKNYSFFSHDKIVAEDYGDYIWKCSFKPMKLFKSYNESSVKELYSNGFKLRDYYIEDNWGKSGTSYDEVVDLYDYDESKSSDNFGYKSVEAVISSPFFKSDTWEMIEHTDGVLDYILSKYDGVILLEGGYKTYYLSTDKIIKCERVL